MPTFKPTSKIEFSRKNGKALIYLARQKVKFLSYPFYYISKLHPHIKMSPPFHHFLLTNNLSTLHLIFISIPDAYPPLQTPSPPPTLHPFQTFTNSLQHHENLTHHLKYLSLIYSIGLIRNNLFLYMTYPVITPITVMAQFILIIVYLKSNIKRQMFVESIYLHPDLETLDINYKATFWVKSFSIISHHLLLSNPFFITLNPLTIQHYSTINLHM